MSLYVLQSRNSKGMQIQLENLVTLIDGLLQFR